MKKELDPTKPIMAHTMNVMRVASFATLPVMTGMPTVSTPCLLDEKQYTERLC